MKLFIRVFFSAAFLIAGGAAVVSSAPSAQDQRVLKQAERLFKKHGKFCVCKDCRAHKEYLKARGLMAGRLGEKTGGKPLFEVPDVVRPRPSRPTPTPPPSNAATSGPVGNGVRRQLIVTQGRPLHPFRNINFPPSSALPELTPSPSSPQSTALSAQSPEGLPERRHGVRIPDPRPRFAAQASGLPQNPTAVLPPAVGLPPVPPSGAPSQLPPGPTSSGGFTGLPGRPVATPHQPSPANGLPGRVVPSPAVPGLPGRPIPTPVGSGLPGRAVNVPVVTGLPGRPVSPSIPGTPIPAPSNPAQNLQARIQTLIRQGVPPAAINMQTGIVRMNLQGHYLDASGRIIRSSRP